MGESRGAKEERAVPIEKIGGIRIGYEDGGSGPAVLLSHGFGATGRMWDGQRKALEGRYRVVTWDMRGHGRTESPREAEEYSAERTVGDMKGLLDRLGIERAVVGGLSLGGYMSLAFYLAHPGRVRALVICDSGPGYRSEESRAKWNRMCEERAGELEAKGAAALEGRSREMQEAVAEHTGGRGLAMAARGMMAQKDSSVIDRLGSVRAPTLIVVGERDEAFRAPADYMARKIEGARLEVIAGAGHAANLDEPENFNCVLLEFLDGL
jgi:pimeloyl-ACP methyl ester carboxylesterase